MHEISMVDPEADKARLLNRARAQQGLTLIVVITSYGAECLLQAESWKIEPKTERS
jgi:hypothetical protein